ncbi:MAG: FAD-dependent oxidoreductase [Oscillospiraceae bacterium]|jgi:thioredoxin reductase (NADPH)|nr:FAD-dependent oxidoreductase [Oscillospiraceae bacterium]
MERYEIAVIGSGPAGVSAALNAKIRGKSLLLFGSKQLSDKVLRSEKISNYPGLPDISGEELVGRLQKQLVEMEISVTEEAVTSIYPMGNFFTLLAGQKEYEAETVILTGGAGTAARIPGEEKLLGRGVSYCATCDGNLYRGKTIAVVCDTPTMESEAAFLAELAGKVYYLPLMKNSTLSGANVENLHSAVREIQGEERVSGVVLADGTQLAVDGIFFIRNSVPPAVLLRNLKMQENHVAVDRQMHTNVEGFFAAGDCTGRPYQIAKAVGEGNIAAHAAVEYLDSRKNSAGGNYAD